MQSPSAAAPPPDGASRLKIFLAALLIALVVAAAYRNSLHVGFYFDDREAITENDSITKLWPPWQALSPPNVHVAGALGRPLVNLSLAVNYQIAESLTDKHDGQGGDGLAVENYHVTNIIFHILAAWALLAVVRRTLLQPALAPRFGPDAFGLAFFIALIWAAHPLLTEVVTCVIQRNEAMVAIFYLLALYCFIRSVDSARIRWWQAGAIMACYLGVATKELMFSAPLIILLYDRTFVAGSFRAAWAQRRVFYGLMVSSWVLLGVLMAMAGQRGGTVGFGLDMAWQDYAMKQCQAVVHYFVLAFWPHPLVMDYGTDVIKNFSKVWLQALILTGLVGATIWALWKRPLLGLAGAWVFIILAPSSSILPLTTQTMAEHRMYLPLVPFVMLVVLGTYAWSGRNSYLPLGALALLLAAGSFVRNRDYNSELSIWTLTAKQVPNSERAHYNLGWVLIGLERYQDAIPEFAAAIKIDPDYGDAHDNLGLCYIRLNDYDTAITEFRTALRIDYSDYQSHYNLGCAYLNQSDWNGALAEFQDAVDYNPDYADAQASLGSAFLHVGEPEKAIDPLEAALKLDPKNPQTLMDYGDALAKDDRAGDAVTAYEKVVALGDGDSDIHKKLASALATQGETARAIIEDQAALRLAADDPEAHYLYGSHLATLGQNDQAVAEFTQAVTLRSNYPEAENSLGSVLFLLNRVPEAEAAYQAAIKLKSDFADAHFNLGTLYLKTSKLAGADTAARLDDAEQELRRTLQIDDDYAEAHNNLGSVLMEKGRYLEASTHFQRALQIDPDYADAKHNLDALQAALSKATN
jgi:tetratricopeptide (TPR) repeat protein